MRTSGYWLLLFMSIFCVYYLWKTGSISRWSSSMRAKALIHFDLSIPSSSSSSLSSSSPRRRQHRNTLSKYMLQVYYRRPDTDIIKAIQPAYISGPLSDSGRIVKFTIPSVNSDQSLETAELLGVAGALIRVRSFDAMTRNINAPEILESRKDDAWRAFNVTSAVTRRSSDTVQFYVYGRFTYRPYIDGPILLLNYSKTGQAHRQRRSVRVEKRDQEDERRPKGSLPRRRRRDSCRRHPLYVDFALIAYDRWVVAPSGYEAYQCTGKCFLPFADHLSPTQHAIVQTLMHGALQHQANGDLDSNKVVGRACCVPTRLAPTSLLYMNDDAVIYEYDYEDMVVDECGCR
ncbi:bone morphogenetic protein 2-like [Odontomachus brunneus]|uniref:bone morphogenetic protein 2-like n=1 Tax=Odontomachus brunneus TaxID=486640 RepID=UPI0013F19C1A|nr:bone morphogenetic protein 2-like [Odontomachus brunneus]